MFWKRDLCSFGDSTALLRGRVNFWIPFVICCTNSLSSSSTLWEISSTMPLFPLIELNGRVLGSEGKEFRLLLIWLLLSSVRNSLMISFGLWLERMSYSPCEFTMSSFCCFTSVQLDMLWWSWSPTTLVAECSLQRPDSIRAVFNSRYEAWLYILESENELDSSNRMLLISGSHL